MMMQKFMWLQHVIGGAIRSSWSGLWLFLFVSAGLWGPSAPFAKAGVILHIDFDPHTDGIQSTHSVLQGELFTANLIMEFTGDTSLGLDSYSFSVNFDNAGMSFVTAMSTPVGGFTAFPSPPELTGLNQVAPFAANSNQLGNGPTTSFLATVGTIDFIAATANGVFTITPFEDPLFDGFFDNQFEPIAATFNAGSVTITGTVIPEPTSAVIVLTALAFGIVLYRHRRFESGQLVA